MSSSYLSPSEQLWRSLCQLRMLRRSLRLDSELSEAELADMAEVLQAALDGLEAIAGQVSEDVLDQAMEVRHAQ